jgi:hypothetical protein
MLWYGLRLPTVLITLLAVRLPSAAVQAIRINCGEEHRLLLGAPQAIQWYTTTDYAAKVRHSKA